MRADRLARFVAMACVAVAVAASPQVARGECTPNGTVVVALSPTDTGANKIVDGCWMPSVAVPSKTLCAHDPTQAHTFTFQLKNDCAMAVKLKLTVKRNTIDFKDADCDIDNGKVLFEDFLAENGGTQTRTCSTNVHSDKKQKKGSYDLVATHVRQNGVETKIKDVKFDPEIILEEKGKHGILWWGALALFAAAAAYAIYRALRRA